MTPEQLKDLREQAKMSQQEMADYLGLRHRSQVHYLETGRSKIAGPKLRLLEELRARLAARK